MVEIDDSKYPMSFEEFVNRLWELFIERGIEKKYWHYFTDIEYMPVHKKEESRLECWYSGLCDDFDKDMNYFTDDYFHDRVFHIEHMINLEKGNYPMTEEEFIKRVKELYLEHSTWDMPTKLAYINSEQGLEDMKIAYLDQCYNYDRAKEKGYPLKAFTDIGLSGNPVHTLDQLTEF